MICEKCNGTGRAYIRGRGYVRCRCMTPTIDTTRMSARNALTVAGALFNREGSRKWTSFTMAVSAANRANFTIEEMAKIAEVPRETVRKALFGQDSLEIDT